jgi:hypothetical protein
MLTRGVVVTSGCYINRNPPSDLAEVRMQHRKYSNCRLMLYGISTLIAKKVESMSQYLVSWYSFVQYLYIVKRECDTVMVSQAVYKFMPICHITCQHPRTLTGFSQTAGAALGRTRERLVLSSLQGDITEHDVSPPLSDRVLLSRESTTLQHPGSRVGGV